MVLEGVALRAGVLQKTPIYFGLQRGFHGSLRSAMPALVLLDTMQIGCQQKGRRR